MLQRLRPFVFVFLWSTGFIGAQYADPYAEPMTTLAIRFAGASLVCLPFALLAGARWPRCGLAIQCMAVGILLHGVYLGGVFAAIDLGLPAGPSALIVSLQPVLTAVFAFGFAAERMTGQRWLGVVLGFVGVALVTAPKLDDSDPWPLTGLVLCIGALIGITVASAWQKRVSPMIDIRAGMFFQYLGGFGLVAPFALTLETRAVEWTPQFLFAMFWMVFVLSLGAFGLLMVLLARGSLVSTTALMYLVPATTAIVAFFMFGETLTQVQIAGLGLSTIGVALVTLKTGHDVVGQEQGGGK